MTQHWFDVKYAGRGRPTVTDLAALLAESTQLHISERTQKDFRHELRQRLHHFAKQGNYKPSQHTILRKMLIYAPVFGMSGKELESYIDEYEAVLSAHQSHADFNPDIDGS